MKNELYSRLERLANLLRSESRMECQALGLQPIQQDALYYLSICNKYSDTPLAVAEYLGLTKGTVSQSLKILEKRELIEKVKDIDDKRVTRLRVTAEGLSYLSTNAPPKDFNQATECLTEQETAELNLLLKRLLGSYQATSGRNGFGVCRNCIHNQSNAGEFTCGLTKDKLSLSDVKLICREFTELFSIKH